MQHIMLLCRCTAYILWSKIFLIPFDKVRYWFTPFDLVCHDFSGEVESLNVWLSKAMATCLLTSQ